jgi:diacylglycerol kinase
MSNHRYLAIAVLARMRSFRYAAQGCKILLVTQPNARIHFLATLLVVSFGIKLELNQVEWSLIVLAIMSVWAAEALNTALELLTDLASPDYHPLAGRVKDVAAAAVLIVAFGAATIGVLLFWPHLF